MFRIWKRRLLFALQVIAAATTAGLGIYQASVGSGKVDWRIVAPLLVVIFLCAGAGAYYTHIQPVRDLGVFVKAALDTQAQHIVDATAAHGIDVRLNIAMVCIWPFQLSWPFKRFKIVWDRGMNNAPDAAIAFAVSKGVAGEAYRTRQDRLVNMEMPELQDLKKWGFSKKEASIIPKFTAIWSFPVPRLGADQRTTQTICGMLNLDSNSSGAFDVLTNHPEIKKLLKDMWLLACALNL